MKEKLEGTERRERILQMLETTVEAISGTSIAKQLGVSRQVIVQDIALLRASNENILSTPRGYLLFRQSDGKITRRFRVFHSSEQIEQELNLIVDKGARVMDVIVEHPVYGEIRGTLPLASRRDVQDFIKRIQAQQGTPLLEISNGVHIHTVEADNLQILEEVEQDLRHAGILSE